MEFARIVYANWTPHEQSALAEIRRAHLLGQCEPDFASLWAANVSLGTECLWDMTISSRELADG